MLFPVLYPDICFSQELSNDHYLYEPLFGNGELKDVPMVAYVNSTGVDPQFSDRNLHDNAMSQLRSASFGIENLGAELTILDRATSENNLTNIKKEAIQNICTVKESWHPLDLGIRAEVFVLCDTFWAAEKILDRDLMLKFQEHFKTDSITASVPRRKALYVTKGDLNHEEFIRFQTLTSKCFENKLLDKNNMIAYSVFKICDGIVVSKAPFPPEPKSFLQKLFGK
jgi:hypothetical protein